jgi:hypothetical protein
LPSSRAVWRNAYHFILAELGPDAKSRPNVVQPNQPGSCALGRATQIAAADEFVTGLFPMVAAIRRTGAKTLEAMSQALNPVSLRREVARGAHRQSQTCLCARGEPRHAGNPFIDRIFHL